jgi:DNA-directed RNA polymerase specialized sigma24 family protein
MTEPALERARAGDAGAFVELVRRHDPELRGLASARLPAGASPDGPLLRAYVEAFRTLPALDPDRSLDDWLRDLVERACAADSPGGGAGNREFWPRLAAALEADSPALAPPELPERRFPVIPRLQRRRR